MNTSIEQTGNKATLTITAGEDDLTPTVRNVYNKLRESVEADGFRKGKAPNNIVEREIGTDKVHAEVIDAAAEKLYRHAIQEQGIRPVSNPEVSVKKFTPYTELELEVTVETMPEVKLPDYTQVSKSLESTDVTEQEVNDVLESLRERLAERQEVERAAQSGDEITIDFKGTRDGEDVPGAQADDYPLLLGSERFIPGFEQELIGLKPGEEKQFSLTFPDDYTEDSLAGKQIDFHVTVKNVTEVAKPEVNDEFAQNAGPFQNLAGLQEDVRNHLQSEKEQGSQRRLENEIIQEVVDNTEVDLPDSMLEQERERVQSDINQRLSEQGYDLETYLQQTGKTQQQHEEDIEEQTRERVKTALVLTEIARAEGLEITPDELEMRMQVLAGQYQDDQMQQEMQKPEARRDVSNQMLAEKTVQQLVQYATENQGAEGQSDANKDQSGADERQSPSSGSGKGAKKQSNSKSSSKQQSSKSTKKQSGSSKRSTSSGQQSKKKETK